MRFLGVLVSTTPERRREVYALVDGMSRPTVAFYVMVTISTIIAAYGLLSNALANQFGRRVPGSIVSEFRYAERSGRFLLFVNVRAPRVVRPEEIAAIQRDLRQFVEPRGAHCTFLGRGGRERRWLPAPVRRIEAAGLATGPDARSRLTGQCP